MPSFLGFNSTKKFRDFLIGKTINSPEGPQTFDENNYSYSKLSNGQNVLAPNLEEDRSEILSSNKKFNKFNPEEYFILEDLKVYTSNKNLGEYPNFEPKEHNLISIMSGDNMDYESELMKFSRSYIVDDPNGPIQSRIKQNFYNATIGQVNLVDVFNGNTATLSGIIKGHTPLINLNYNITVAKTLPGKAIDFIQTVSGVEFPWSEIPGTYFSDPRYLINDRPTSSTGLGSIWQDVTGNLGSLVGIERRPKITRKPSDLMIEYMGEGQRQLLYRNLSFSKYGPDYTTTARSENSSSLFNGVETAAETIKNLIGLEAPQKSSYIGDDRGNNVLYTTSDLMGRKVRGSYYLSLLFDQVATELFSNERGYINNDGLYGPMTWTSPNSKNKNGLYNNSWTNQVSKFDERKSTSYDFREDSILGQTQALLNSLPLDGLASRSHVANVIDQTSRYFKEGDRIISRGSAVKYVDKNGVDVGEEFCRVWTKDRPYFTFGDTMKRTGNIRKIDGSIMGGGGTPWNLNIAPMSNGKKSFENSTNIKTVNGNVVAKKFMFSIENLAWKNSQIPGFSYNDLPFVERGPNGGRVMWFPPYNLQVSENSSVGWSATDFIGRPESLYTYTNTRRTGTVSFKIVVDHPSILNLLVRDYFDGMSDEDSDAYINAFFSGCVDLDFYDLIQRFTTLDSDDIDLITRYLNDKTDPEIIKRYKLGVENVVKEETPDVVVNNIKVFDGRQLLFPNDTPSIIDTTKEISGTSYRQIFKTSLKDGDGTYVNETLSKLGVSLDKILLGNTINDKKDRYTLLKRTDIVTDINELNEIKNGQDSKVESLIASGRLNVEKLVSDFEIIKIDMGKGDVQEIVFNIESSASPVGDVNYNNKLSVRRSHSILMMILENISNGVKVPTKWKSNGVKTVGSNTLFSNEYTFKELGYDTEGKIIINANNYGEKVTIDHNFNCTETNFKEKGLLNYAPVSFGCRQSKLNIKYTKAVKKQEKVTTDDDSLTPTTKLQVETEKIINDSRKPNIDVMKRIIMKTLSEGYYFKKVEETDPLVFSSLKEKLKYFHPAFHSMTPEGLNGRLTFINQCGRPGDTIPIKGINDDLDMVARNTSFGAPPVCVLRIGDFYNSKILIDTIQISFDETTWDLNPEGIGVQPMLADVTLNVTFIGGQGIEKPVEQLQNALTSNFYANTEFYDERSVSTNLTIGGKDVNEFTKEFLEELQQLHNEKNNQSIINNNTSNLKNGQHIGDGEETLTYDTIINRIDENVNKMYNELNNGLVSLSNNHGSPITNFLFTNEVRVNNVFDFNGTDNIELLGVIGSNVTHKKSLVKYKNVLLSELNNMDFSEVIGFNKDFNSVKKTIVNDELKKNILETVTLKLDNLMNDRTITDIELIRNEIIVDLDKINFLMVHGFDCVIKENKYYKTFLDGYDGGKISDTVKPIFKKISKNQEKLNKQVTNFYDPNNDTLNTVTITEILRILLNDLTFNSQNLNSDDIGKVNKRIKNFVEKGEYVKNLKFDTDLSRKNSNEISFVVLNEEENTTDTIINEEIKLLFINNVQNKTNNKLNFYRDYE